MTEEEEESTDETDNSYTTVEPHIVCNMKISSPHMTGLGFTFGILVLSLQLVSGLQSYDLVGAWSNLFSILADVFVVLLGLSLVSLGK